jgi:hypothetical protein
MQAPLLETQLGNQSNAYVSAGEEENVEVVEVPH